MVYIFGEFEKMIYVWKYFTMYCILQCTFHIYNEVTKLFTFKSLWMIHIWLEQHINIRNVCTNVKIVNDFWKYKFQNTFLKKDWWNL